MAVHNWAMIALLTFEAMLAAVVAGTPDALGVPQVALNWLVIINVGVVALANQMAALGSEKPAAGPPTGMED